MTDNSITGAAVMKVANDTSLVNTEPVALTQALMQIIGVIVAVLVFKGYIEPEEGTFITAQSIILLGGIISVAALIGSALGRARAYSPRTAASIAVDNASSLVTAPVMSPPP
jgi:hypothetical protein